MHREGVSAPLQEVRGCSEGARLLHQEAPQKACACDRFLLLAAFLKVCICGCLVLYDSACREEIPYKMQPAAGRSQQASQRQRSDQGGSPTTEDMACTLADREFANSHSLRWGVCTKRSPCAVTNSSDSALGLTRRREILAWAVNAHGGSLGNIEASYVNCISTNHMRRLHNWLQVEIEGRTLQLHLEQACAARYLHPRHPALLLSPLLCTVCALEIEEAGPSVRPLCLFDRKLCWAAEQPQMVPSATQGLGGASFRTLPLGLCAALMEQLYQIKMC